MGCCLSTSVRFLRRRVEKKSCWEFVATRYKTPAERTRLLKKDALSSRLRFVEEIAFCSSGLKKAEWERREMNSSDLRWPRVKATNEMQKKNCSK